MTPRGAIALVVAGCVAVAGAARAQDAPPQQPPQSQLDRAREAYDRGAAAYDHGDWEEALDDLDRADALVPNAVTLELALKASLKADEALRGMELVDRADGRGATGELAATADQVRRAFEPRTGRLTVVCPVPLSCTAAVDDAPFDVGVARRVLAGDHVLSLTVDGRASRLPVAMKEHGAVEILASAYAPPPPPPPPPVGRKKDSAATEHARGGLPPAVFWIGVAATGVLAGATTASAIDTSNKYAAYKSDPSTSANPGIAAQTRTNVLLAVTGGVALATAAVGLFAVRWSSPKSTGSNAVVLSGTHVAFVRTF